MHGSCFVCEMCTGYGGLLSEVICSFMSYMDCMDDGGFSEVSLGIRNRGELTFRC